MRLQKVLQQAGVSSRRGAAEIIAQGRVCVAGAVQTEPSFDVDVQLIISNEVVVTVDGAALSLEEQVLYALHKPTDVICSMKQQGTTPCIANLLTEIPQRVVPVGRLDKDVCGLLLLTNNGLFADGLLHPRNEILRTYWAVCSGSIEILEKAQKAIRVGVPLEDGLAKADSLDLLPLDEAVTGLFSKIPLSSVVVELQVREGRHHFVKRLLGALNLPVLRLARVAFGPYELGSLPPGSLRKEKFQSLS